jgi:hypothetical protein
VIKQKAALLEVKALGDERSTTSALVLIAGAVYFEIMIPVSSTILS